MKLRIVRGVESARLADILPPPLRRRLPGTLRRGGPYTVLIFPLGQDPVKSGAAAKAVARLGEGDAAPVLAFGAEFTADALAILDGRGVTVVSVGDFHWTDEAFERIRTSVASPRKAPGPRRP
jgi:hypothetical protein